MNGSSDWVWLVLPVTPVPDQHSARTYSDYGAVRRDWPRAPERIGSVLGRAGAEWFEESWAEPGDRVLFQALMLVVRT